MNVFMFIYDKFSDFEITQLLLLLHKESLVTVGFEKGLVESYGHLKVHADQSIDELDISKVDLFIIPGGEPKHFIRDENYSEKIKKLNQKLQSLSKDRKLIAAICGGPTFLANAGILDKIKSTSSKSEDEDIYYQNTIFTDEDIEISGNIITAKGQAFTEFAVAVAKECGVLKSNEEVEEAISWFRNKK